MERYYQPEIETASREQIKAWQDERLVKQVRNVWDNVEGISCFGRNTSGVRLISMDQEKDITVASIAKVRESEKADSEELLKSLEEEFSGNIEEKER